MCVRITVMGGRGCRMLRARCRRLASAGSRDVGGGWVGGCWRRLLGGGCMAGGGGCCVVGVVGYCTSVLGFSYACARGVVLDIPVGRGFCSYSGALEL